MEGVIQRPEGGGPPGRSAGAGRERGTCKKKHATKKQTIDALETGMMGVTEVIGVIRAASKDLM